MGAAVSIILTHVVGALPEFGAQLYQLEKMQSSFLIQSLILWAIAEHNKVSEIKKLSFA